jgi:hypothetical protein
MNEDKTPDMATTLAKSGSRFARLARFAEVHPRGPGMTILRNCFRSADDEERDRLLFRAGTERHVAVVLAIPEQGGGHLIGSGLFDIDRHHRSFLEFQFFQTYFPERQIDDDEFPLGCRSVPGIVPSPMNHQQRNAAAFGNIGCELGADFWIAVSKETGKGIDYLEVIFHLVHEGIFATRRNDQIFNAVSIQVGLEGLPV